jgi:integrase/recombinase XerD
MDTQEKFPTLVQSYFCQYLINQRRVSNKTVESYRDTFCLLFKFIGKHLGKPVSQLSLADINADLVAEFLDYLENERKNSINSRNIRLAAIRSFLNYVTYQEPDALPVIRRVLAIPIKRYDHVLVGSLSREEVESILNALDTKTWSGQRDRVLLTTLYNTGARVSEIIAVKRCDIEIDQSTVVRLHGKGRKERSVPLWKGTSALIRKWLKQINTDPQTPLFPNYFGRTMSRSGVEKRIKAAVKKATTSCPSLKNKKVSPHVFRHTTAMHLLQSGIDMTVIALWLGHESINTTHKYMEADTQMKERVLHKFQESKQKIKRKPLSDSLITFLESL